MINIALPHTIIETGSYTSDDPPTGMVFKTFSDACINCAGGGLYHYHPARLLYLLSPVMMPSQKL